MTVAGPAHRIVGTHIPMPVPAQDPLPWLTDRYREAGAFQQNPNGDLTDHAVHAMRRTIQSIVTGLQNDDRVFRAVFGKTATAATNMRARLVYIGTKAMQDPTLSEGRLAAIMTGLAYHETAHINHDREFVAFIIKSLTEEGHPHVAAAHDVHNIGQDLRIEARIAKHMPGYAPTLPATLWYVTKGSRVTHMPAGISKSAARNLFFAAVRAPWTVEDWDGWEDALVWGQAWAARFIATDKRKDVLVLVREALDTIVEWSERAPTEPSDEPIGCGPVAPPPPETDEVGSPDPWAEPPPEDGTGPDDETPQPPKADEPDAPSENDDDDEPGEGTDDDEPEEDDDDPDGDGTGEDDDDEESDDEDDDDGGPTGDEPDTDEKPQPIDEPGEDDDDGQDLSDTWSDDVADTDSGEGGGRNDETSETTDEVPEGKSIEDVEFPACAADALLTADDHTFERTATRVEKAKEEERTRVYEHNGWPARSVRRIWDFNTPDE